MLQVFVEAVCEVLVFRRTWLVLSAAVLLSVVCTYPVVAQQATLQPNDALILENIPPIPASIAERAARYTDFRTAAM